MEEAEFFDAVWDAAVKIFGRQTRRDPFWLRDDPSIVVWTRLFVTLINEGVDVHRLSTWILWNDFPSWYKPLYNTALSWILSSSECHREVEAALSCWLKILLAGGIDVDRYLQREKAHLPENVSPYNHNWAAWKRMICTKKIAGFNVPMWRRYVDPDSKAYEARNEFKNLGCLFEVEIWPDLHYLSALEAEEEWQQHVLLKNCELYSSAEEDWPFIYDFVRDHCERAERNVLRREGKGAAGGLCSSFKYAKELAQERFSRRQARKSYRSGYLKREKRPLNIPGAWPDLGW
ncbi:hypothetical protein CORC01_08605 [Colletotrichum orchidophilum]|uniref:Uncharacterized protein n=1 Tax=Colletotrichum orchidophilum TaxID=1209926 RepID=A0A1G4B3S1_9PEZI|nr:uncharacterized protein CORC01_08605 [Colletotrichum orchidophilum]OHE96068.1 hypothetical protein CORC01_08605 [Colletotrichum orchidophilum]